MTGSAAAIRVVIADDHTLFRQGIRELVCTDPGIAVVAEGASGDQALALAAEHVPDVLLLDVEMPGPGARQVIQQLSKTHPAVRTVVLTMHDEPTLVRELLEAGAAAYLIKTIAREELIAAVRSVHRNRSNVLVSVSRETLGGVDPQRPAAGGLSARELDVLRLTAQAYSNAQIGTRLFITEGTVKRHLTNIYAKLGAVSRLDAVRKADAAGLLGAFPSSDPAKRAT